MVEIHLDTVFPEEKMDKILGDFVAGGGGDIDVSWKVNQDEAVIAQGSITQYGYSPIWGGGHSGLAIGSFSAEKGNEYALYINTKNKSIDWNQADPYIVVGLHPVKLEGYLVLQIIGLLIMSALGIALLVITLIVIVAERYKKHGSDPSFH